MGVRRRGFTHWGSAVETLRIDRIKPEEAEQALRGLEAFDPRGIMTARDLHRYAVLGQCFSCATDTASGAYILDVEHGQAWVQAAMARGPFNFLDCMLEVVERQAQGMCHSVAFQTKRRGLVRRAEKKGYRVVGWILKKELEQ